MPITYQIDPMNAIVRTKMIGDVTVDQVFNHFHELAQDPNCPDRADVLFDLSELTWIPRSDDLRAATREISSLRTRVQFGACAIVACTDVLFGMSRMFQVFAEEHFREVWVFRSVADAGTWLAKQR